MGVQGEKCFKKFFKVFERQNKQNQTIYELSTEDNKSKYSRNPMDIFKFVKNFVTNFTPWRQLSKAGTTEFLRKIPNGKKYLVNIFR